VSFDWSFSAERCFKRCQRQYYFRDVVAWHSGKDPLRRESFILKQLKTFDQWQGLLVHRGIEKLVVPHLSQNERPDWGAVIAATVKMAEGQREFSRARRYRDLELSKSKAGDDYCALLCHEQGRDLSAEEWDETVGVVERALRNLAGLDELWQAISGKGKYFAELPIHLHYDGVHIIVQMDLLCFRGFGKPIIVDWKVSDAKAGSDARTQMGVYAWAMTRSPTWNVQQMENVELLEVQLLTPAMFTHRCDDEIAIELENRIFRSIDEIRSLCGDGNYKTLDQEDFAMARNPNTCFFCPFRKVCVASLVKPPLQPPPQVMTQGSLFDEADCVLTM
jgi:hypothetical protein